MKIVDLTLPARAGDGRLGTENEYLDVPHTFATHGFQSSTFKMFAHFGTHVDAPRHLIRDGDPIDQVLSRAWVGRGAVFDLSAVADGAPIDMAALERADPGLTIGDIAVLRTDQEWAPRDFYSRRRTSRRMAPSG